MQKLVNAVNTFGDATLKPTGGVDEGKVGVTCPYVLDWFASHFDDRGPCATAGSSWLLPVKDDQGKEFITSVLHDAGYSYNPELISLRSGGGTKGGVSLDIELTGTPSGNLPHALPAGEIWTRVNLQASY